MPIGSYANLYYIAKELERKNPDDVLDLGIGLGMNGVLVRQYVDQIYNKQTFLCGVEIFSDYDNPIWRVYSHISFVDILGYVWNACDRIKRNVYTCTFDIILLTDVIEHFSEKDGRILLENLPLLLKPSGIILVSTPGVFIQQGAVNGNVYEQHLSFWPPKDFPPRYTTIKQGKDHHGDETTIMKYVKS